MTTHATRRIAITGGSGFVGSCVLSHLTQQNHVVKALAREGVVRGAAQTMQGDLFDNVALDELLRDCDTLVHLVGIIRENPDKGQTFERIHHRAVENIVARAEANGVKRIVHMSALGTREHAASEYHATKWRGEQVVRSSTMTWTIFRPSLILGPGGEFVQLMRDLWTKVMPPFVPYFGKGVLGLGGSGNVQPIGVEDVAHCFAAAVTNQQAENKVYELGGPEAMSWPTMYRRAKAVIDGAKRKPIVAIPVWEAKLMTSLPIPGLPFNRAQVIMAEEDSVCDVSAAKRDFDFEPMTMEKALEA